MQTQVGQEVKPKRSGLETLSNFFSITALSFSVFGALGFLLMAFVAIIGEGGYGPYTIGTLFGFGAFVAYASVCKIAKNGDGAYVHHGIRFGSILLFIGLALLFKDTEGATMAEKSFAVLLLAVIVNIIYEVTLLPSYFHHFAQKDLELYHEKIDGEKLAQSLELNLERTNIVDMSTGYSTHKDTTKHPYRVVWNNTPAFKIAGMALILNWGAEAMASMIYITTHAVAWPTIICGIVLIILGLRMRTQRDTSIITWVAVILLIDTIITLFLYKTGAKGVENSGTGDYAYVLIKNSICLLVAAIPVFTHKMFTNLEHQEVELTFKGADSQDVEQDDQEESEQDYPEDETEEEVQPEEVQSESQPVEEGIDDGAKQNEGMDSFW